MAFSNAQQSRLFIGPTHFSGYSRGFQFPAVTDNYNTTALTSTAKEFLPGMTGGTASLDMMLDTDGATGSQFATLTTLKGIDPYPGTWLPFGYTAGSAAFMGAALLDNITIGSTLTDVVTMSLSTVAADNVDFGSVVETLTAVTADTNGTSVDNSAATSNGGVAHLHVTAYSGLTSDAIIVEHSTDNSTWATLGTFTTVTALTSQRLVIAAGTTVNRYLRVSDDVTGVGSITRLVTFARR